MVTIKDKSPDIWGWPAWDNDDIIRYEDGTTKPLSLDQVVFERGKYAGQTMADMSDNWYLNFLINKAVEEGDNFLEKCARMRLLQIK